MNHKIGLMGFGVVGQGYHAIAEAHDKDLLPFKIVIKEKGKTRPDNLPFTYNPDELIEDSDIGIELISDSEVAYSFIKAILEKGKKVITANKKVVAAHLPELVALQQKFGGTLLYEAAVAASIPVLSNLQTQFYGDEILELKGILNGSSNYILSQVFHNGLTLGDALSLAQAEGFAEADPSFDINGSDVASKLTILLAHTFDEYHPEDTIPCYGIEHIGTEEVELAKSLGLSIKLIASAKRTQSGVVASILPTFIDPSDAISSIEWEYNCVQITSKNLGEQFFKGKGAGCLPTGAAVFSDLIKSTEGFQYTYGPNLIANRDAELQNMDLKVVLKSNDPHVLENYNLPKEGYLETESTYWYVGSLNTDFLLKNRSVFIRDGISIINAGSAVTIETLKGHLQSLKHREDLQVR
jgi:homoserine dehydrogenase